MEHNEFLGKLHRHAFSMKVNGSAVIGPGNKFTLVSNGAFKQIEVGDDMKIEFKDNKVHGADYGALQFHRGRVSFTGSLFTGLKCPCEGAMINDATRELNQHIQKLLGGGGATFAVSLNFKVGLILAKMT